MFYSTDIITEIANSGSYSECSYTDFAIPPTTVSAGSTQNWQASEYLTASSLIVDSGGTASLYAGDAVTISPGTVFAHGSNVVIGIKPCTYNVCTPPVEKIGRIPSTNNDIQPPGPTEDKTTSTDMEVFPNPTTSILNIKLPISPDNNAKILIYSDEGKLVKQTDARQIQFQINVSDLTDGIYPLVFKSNNTYATKQFTVTKL